MENEIILNNETGLLFSPLSPEGIGASRTGYSSDGDDRVSFQAEDNHLPEILFITSYPPRECGIATYSQDLIRALNNKFSNSFRISVCPLESENEKHDYAAVRPAGRESFSNGFTTGPDKHKIKYILDTDHPKAFARVAANINASQDIRMVVLQHEFGFFHNKEDDFREFMEALIKPVVLVFHTVLPRPDELLKVKVQQMISACEALIVMTRSSADILVNNYEVPREKITVIPHGTHLVPHLDKDTLKKKYGLQNRKILSTFGLLSSGKSIETALEALPAIVKENENVLFLIIGKTHPSVVKQEGEKYRTMLEAKTAALHLEKHVKFIDRFLPLPELLEYLQLTDIYLFTSKDPHQAVSGTFSYAISCGCCVISTPIPHAREVLKNGSGIIIDFEAPLQLSDAVVSLLKNEQLEKNISSNGLHRMASTAWENAAIAHAHLFEKVAKGSISLQYNLPPVNLDHIKKMTTGIGIIQFSKLNQPDPDSGYTLDDNARALIALCQHYDLTKEETDIKYIRTYFGFIKYCLQPEGYFLNYVNSQKGFTEQNNSTNLADANGRAIWALGYLIAMGNVLPGRLIEDAESTMHTALLNVNKIHSTRSMAFIIKGLYYQNKGNGSDQNLLLLRRLADRLVQMYRHESSSEWQWFESYLTYANSLLPEALLCAWSATGEPVYKEIARTSFDFLLTRIFKKDTINVISNKHWLHKGDASYPAAAGGEQPIDVAYTVLALSKFYDVFKEEAYLQKMQTAFNWFLGSNHLSQIIYNPCTGGCYDGLEDHYVNLNQGAESTVSCLMARLTLEKSLRNEQHIRQQLERYLKSNRHDQLA